MYRIKRFSSDEKKSGLSTGAKVLAGAGALAGGLMAAKKGLLGSKAAMKVNEGLMKVGKKIGNDKVVASAAKDYTKAANKATGNKSAALL